MLNGLDLFSGIGGISEALAPWVRTVAYCEKDESAQQMLLSRMYRGEVHIAPIWTDVTTLRGSMLPAIDVISGGFPCQDLSVAGLRKGLGGERSGLFWQIVRLAEETKAPIIFLENVWPGVRKYIPTIRNSFESIGYKVRDGVLEARDVGAPHKRARWFAVATNTNCIKSRLSTGRRQGKKRKEKILSRVSLEDGNATNPDGKRLEISWDKFGIESQQPFSTDLLEGDTWDDYASFFLRMDHGISNRSNRLRALGNSVVPQQARKAFEILTGFREVKDGTN